MVETTDKWIQMVSDLIDRTQTKKISWTSYVPKDSPRVKIVYLAKHKDKGLRLYRREALKGSELSPWSAMLGNADEQIVLEVIDDKQNSLWKFPELPALSDLIEAVSYQVAGIDDFLTDLLGK